MYTKTLIKGGNEKVIIPSHFGVQFSRCGFTQEGKGMMKNALWTSNIHFLDQAKYLVENGFSVLMFDIRNHGNSEQTDWVSWGLKECKDIVASVKYISEHKDYKNASIGLFSICMGQGTTTFAFGMEKEMKNFKNLKAMIFSSTLDLRLLRKSNGIGKLFN